MFQCQLCNKQLSSENSLSYHMTHQVCQRKIKYICQKCHQELSSKQMLAYHIDHDVCHKQSSLIRLSLKPQPQQPQQPQPQPQQLPQPYANMTRDQLIMQLLQLEAKYNLLREIHNMSSSKLKISGI